MIINHNIEQIQVWKKSYNDISFYIFRCIVSNHVTSETSSPGKSKAL